MLGLTGFLGLTQISQIPRYSLWVGNLTDVSACGLARTDSTLLLGSHGSHRSHGIALWVGNLTDVSARVWACVDRWAARGSLSRIYFSDPSDLSDLSDKLDIFKNNP